MKIGMIGSGNMGRALGVRFAEAGHDVFFGARRLEQAFAAAGLAGHAAKAGSNDEAAAFGTVLIWNMREPVPAQVLADLSLLAGKIVVDLNNRDYAAEARTGAWFGEAIAEQLQRNAPDAHVVKAFNLIAMETFDVSVEAVQSSGGQVFLAGADGIAKKVVSGLAEELGYGSIDVGVWPAALSAVEALGDVIRLIMIDGGYGGRAHLQLTVLPSPVTRRVGEREASIYG